MRKIKIVANEYYHIYNRGNNKRPIFLDEKDLIRFLFLILFFQAPMNFYNINRHVNYFVKHQELNISAFNISEEIIKKIIENRYVELVSFTLMPNHFHLIVYGLQEKGISQYMQRVLDAYTKYFNARYGVSGHLFQGPFQVVHIKNNEQLLYLSAYIHRNPREISKWISKEHLFPWSSYQDYVDENRWKELLKKDIISKQFPSKESYKVFVEKSGAKELPKELLLDHC